MWRPSWSSWSLPRGPVLWFVPVGLLQLHVVDLFPCRDCVISANPRGVTFHSWSGAGGVLAIQVVVIGFDLPTLQATTKELQGQGPPVLSVASVSACGRFCSLRCPGGCYLYPVQRHIVTKISTSVNLVNSSHGLPKLPYTLCLLVWLVWYWWLGLLYPMLPHLGIHQGFLWLFHASSLECQITCF